MSDLAAEMARFEAELAEASGEVDGTFHLDTLKRNDISEHSCYSNTNYIGSFTMAADQMYSTMHTDLIRHAYGK